MRRASPEDPDSGQAAWTTGLRMLGRRELSAAQVRTRLLQKGYSPAAVDEALSRLLASGALDDARVARAGAHTRLRIKRQGRERVRRELGAIGIDRDVADRAVAEAFGDADEDALVDRALDARLRTGSSLDDPAVRRRVTNALVRQGFSFGAISAAFRRRRASAT